MKISRGDIILVNLNPSKGSEQGGFRPCVVVQNDVANKFSPTTIVVPLTSQISDKKYPTEVFIEISESNLPKRSIALCNQIKTISITEREIKKISVLPVKVMSEIDNALKVSLALN
jgi:mRNA interferase MazF